jgi:hypothetical protein
VGRNINMFPCQHFKIRLVTQCILLPFLCILAVGCTTKTEDEPVALIIPLGGTRYVDISSNRNQVTIGGLDTISVIYKDDSDKVDKIVYHLSTTNGWLRGVDTNADGVIDIRIFGRNYRHSLTNDGD